ncbi:hypothetical protein [Xanthocytophaga agilis]|uniref:Uncharacterized protein n=1 Tax=Xanthocytophaga agilis TaxID=3048010 RepID=A0AAE3R0P0_9BACT|nr:hypothetical protein [Xanthocytophaga agilis]MDJ1501566.1 hypothetical protein [Xanthocytophaga agilis]
MLIDIEKPFINLEIILADLQGAFPEYVFILRQGNWEQFIELQLSRFSSITIWYSPREKAIELSDNIPIPLLRKKSRERRRQSIIIEWNPRGNSLSIRPLLLSIHSLERSKVKNQLKNFLQAYYR